MAEAAANTVEYLEINKLEEIAEDICELADKNLDIGDDLVALFIAELEKLEGEDVEGELEIVKEELESLRNLPWATDTTPESRDSKLSSCLPSFSFRTAFGYLKKKIIGNSAVKTSQRTGVEVKCSTKSPDGTIKTIEVFAGITQTFAAPTPGSNANNSQSIEEDEK